MKSRPERIFNVSYLAVSLVVLSVVTLRAVLVPFSHDEVATFFFYIQSGKFIPFFSHGDANGHFLTSFTSWLTYSAFGSEVWSLRIPCVAACIILLRAVYLCTGFFSDVRAKIVFSSFFILSFNFLAYYSLCRGYGFSMAFLVYSVYHLVSYNKNGASRNFYGFLITTQLALSANLTFVTVVSLLSVWLIFFMYRHNKLFRLKAMIILILHFGVIACWVKYALFLQESGALYYGAGDNYWTVTFQSLIETIFFRSATIDVLVLVAAIWMLARFIWKVFIGGIKNFKFDLFNVSFISLAVLIAGFWLLKNLFGVNYPEDRTGLFFYVFFAFAFCAMLEETASVVKTSALVLPVLFALHFVMHVNIQVHPWRVYETMPQRFFDRLAKEQQKSGVSLTVAGHRVREFFYGFMNYNSNVKLSHMTSPEALQMNCDYALAYCSDQPWYEKYYDEIETEPYWDFRLLKRKSPLVRTELYGHNGYDPVNGDQEYFNTYEKTDTTFNSKNPIEAEFTFSVNEAPKPLIGWLVLQADAADESEENVFVRVPLNLVKGEWSGTRHFSTKLVTGNIPLRIKRIVAYFWNVKKERVSIQFESFRLYQLNGEGVNVISKAPL